MSNRPDQIITMIRPPSGKDCSDGLIEIKNRFGSKIITLDRLVELTPWPGDCESKEAGGEELIRNIDEEIARDN